jgi:peptide deformylase
VNPRLELSERRVTADEACLSAPGVWWPLERAYMVVAKGRVAFGKAVTVRALGVLARVLQHEVDHLDGVLFIDHLDDGERARFLAEASPG